MKYQVISRKTDEVKAEFYTRHEAEETMEYEFSWDTHYIKTITPCRECGNEGYERSDWYGISTGHWCEECYEHHYPYKKERYETEEYDGFGERLEDY
jgi:hypothetical protein